MAEDAARSRVSPDRAGQQINGAGPPPGESGTDDPRDDPGGDPRDEQARRASVDDVADGLSQLVRCLTWVRNQFLAEARHDVEWSAHLLIAHLAGKGPMRLSALAAVVQSDPSTVSRQVAALVKEGYVERRPDPEDGRAVLLGVTAAGERVYRDYLRIRNEQYQDMLAQWSEHELATFSDLLRRFVGDIEANRPRWARSRERLGRIPTYKEDR